jgi:hypothetical protein
MQESSKQKEELAKKRTTAYAKQTENPHSDDDDEEKKSSGQKPDGPQLKKLKTLQGRRYGRGGRKMRVLFCIIITLD